MSELYDADYYERGKATRKSCYTNYHWMPAETIAMAHSIIDHLTIHGWQTVLDFGCAKGYLVKALRLCGISAYGVDVSEYAIRAAEPSERAFVWQIDSTADIPVPPSGYYDWVICKDVLEHIAPNNLEHVLGDLSAIAPRCFAVIPLGEDGHYYAAENDRDRTHQIREPMIWWKHELAEYWPKVRCTYAVDGLKERWTEERAHGFITAKKEEA